MSIKNLETKKCRGRASKLSRFLRREGKKYCAVALCASLIAGNLGSSAVAADESTVHEFGLDRVALYEALQEAVMADEIVDGTFTFAGEAADTYDSLFNREDSGNLYELKPEIEDNGGALSLRIFARLDGEIEFDSAYEIDGTEEMIFLLTNTSKEEKTAVISVDGKKTEEIKVAPKSEVLSDEELEAYNSAAEQSGPGVNGETDASGENTVVIGGSGSGSSGGGSGSGGGSSDSSIVESGSSANEEDETSDGASTTDPEQGNIPAAGGDQETGESQENNDPQGGETGENNKTDESADTEENGNKDPEGEGDTTTGDNQVSNTDGNQPEGNNSDVSTDGSEKGNSEVNGNENKGEGGSDTESNGQEASNEGSDSNPSDDPQDDAGEAGGGDGAEGGSVAAVSYHKTYLVAATPSNAEEDEKKVASPSDASDSNADENMLDGMAYDTVLMDGTAVAAFAITFADLAMDDIDLAELATSSNALRIYNADFEDVSVEVRTIKGTFPEDAELQVTKLTDSDEQYETAEEALKKEGTRFDGMMALDISFVDDDGNEFEPDNARNVKVSVQMNNDFLPEDVDPDSLKVHHLAEVEEEIQVQDVADTKPESEVEGTVEVIEDEAIVAAEFAVESFSTFAITWKTGSGNKETTHFEFTAHYVDMDADMADNEIRNISVIDVSVGDGSEVTLADYKKDIYDFNFVGIYHKYGEEEKEIESLHFETKTDGYWWNPKTTYYVTFNYADGNQIEVAEENIKNFDSNIYYKYSAINEGRYKVHFYENAYNTGSEKTELAVTDWLSVEDGIIVVPVKAIGVSVPNETMTSDGVTYKFYGWSLNYNANYTSKDHIYSPNAEYIELQAKDFGKQEIGLYAIWGVSGALYEKTVTKFFIRLDGEKPYEPSAPPVSEYSDGIEVTNALKEYKHIYNDLAAVAANLNASPNENQIKNVVKSYDPATQTVIWYVIKHEGDGWHVDGVLQDKTKWTLAYDANCDAAVENIIPSVQYSTEENAIVMNTVIRGTFTQVDTPPVRTGYIFKGWNTERDGTGDWYIAGSSIGPYGANVTVTLYAQWKRDTATQTVAKIWDDNGNATRKRPPSVTLTVIGNALTGEPIEETVVLTSQNMDAQNSNKWSKELPLPKTDEDGNPYTYSVKEEDVPAGYTAIVSKEDLTVTNKLDTVTITVGKTVAGSFGDRERKFVFSYQIGNDDEVPFKLSHGGGEKVIEVPYGATVIVKESEETPEEYKTTYKVDDGKEETGRRHVFVNIMANSRIQFTNTNDAEIDNGVLLDSLPYVLILAAVAAGVAFFVIRKRREDESDLD